MKLSVLGIKKHYPLAILIATLLTFGILWLWPIFQHFELKFADLKFQLRKTMGDEPAMHQDIVIVELDDESKIASGYGLWPYSYYARIIETLNEGDPTTIGMDFMYTVSIDTSGWKNLTKMMLKTENTINPYLVITSDDLDERLNSKKYKNVLDQLKYDRLPKVNKGVVPHVVDIPYKSGGMKDDFMNASLGIGFVNIEPDPDGILRRLPIISEVNGMLAPHFFLRLLSEHVGYELSQLELIDNHTLILRHFPFENTYRDINIPLDGKGNMLINFISSDKINKQKRNGEFNLLSAWALYNSDRPPDLKGKTIIFGDHSAAAKDYNVTPIDRTQYNPMIFAMAMSNILNGAFIYSYDNTEPYLLLIMVLVLILLALRGDVLWFGIGSLLAIISYFAITSYLFISLGWQLPVMNVIIPILVSSGTTLILMIYNAQVKMDVLEGSLQSYLPPHLMEQMKNDPDMQKLGGERKRISVAFSDIAGFTSFTDQADPAEVQAVLEEYFAEMTAIVFKHNGIVDKYMGDGILAFFENPPDGVTSAQAAVKSAVQMMEKAAALDKKYNDQKRFPFSIYVGVATGYAQVGNIGPPEKVDYTIIGSVVNRASRLDGPGDPGDILMDEDTYYFVKDDYEIDDVGVFELKGFEKPVQVYRLK